MKNFAQKYGPWALVTGASSGIGDEYARQLAALGLNLVLVARREERLISLAGTLKEKHGIEVRVLPLDLTEEGYLEAIADATQDIEVGLLVNNAGMGSGGPFVKTSLSRHQKLHALNCTSPTELSFHFGQLMSERKRGGIINVASIMAYFPSPFTAHYAASKVYLRNLTEALAYEMKSRGVAVQVLCPGFVRSELTEGVKMKKMEPEVVVRISLRKLGRKVTVIPGLVYQILGRGMVSILPRSWMTAIVGKASS